MGMFGEFLCCQIAKDNNFYPNLVARQNNMVKNRYEYVSVIDHHLWLTHSFHTIPEHLNDHFSSRFSEKHIVARTHAVEMDSSLNLKRIKKVQLYCNEEWWLFCHLLAVIKVFSATMLSPGMQRAKLEWSGRMYDQCKFPELTEYFLDNIEQITMLELIMITEDRGYLTCREYMEYYISFYQQNTIVHNVKNDWTYLDPVELFKNPEEQMPRWKEVFDLAEDFDLELLKSYHARNLQLIETEFGKSYEQIRQGDYLTDISNYCENFIKVFKRAREENPLVFLRHGK